jgi:hypothetical protein
VCVHDTQPQCRHGDVLRQSAYTYISFGRVVGDGHAVAAWCSGGHCSKWQDYTRPTTPLLQELEPRELALQVAPANTSSAFDIAE